jgi:hypothetical protein
VRKSVVAPLLVVLEESFDCPWGKTRTMERLRKRKDATSSPASVLAAGGAKRTRLAKLASASNIDQEQRVDDEEHHQMGSITKNEPVIQQLGQIDSTVQQRLSSDPVISSAPSQSEVLMVGLPKLRPSLFLCPFLTKRAYSDTRHVFFLRHTAAYSARISFRQRSAFGRLA